MKSGRLAVVLGCLGVLVAAAAGCGMRSYAGIVSQPARPSVALSMSSVDGRTRLAKVRLVQRLRRPPKVVIFGGSRAMKFDPGDIRRRTGLSGLNLAVTHARPEDTWALLNLLHARFPRARFRFLWVIHCDEFIRRPIDAVVLLDPKLSRFFPRRLVEAQLPAAVRRARGEEKTAEIDIQQHGPLKYAPNGYVVKGFFSGDKRPRKSHSAALAVNIRKELWIYATHPVTPYRQSVRYFRKDLAMMVTLAAARPVLVAAPFDTRIYAATLHHGWGARHRRLLALLAGLRRHDRFSFLDLSRATAHGFVPSDFYDGIHLTPRAAMRVVDLVMQRFPHAL